MNTSDYNTRLFEVLDHLQVDLAHNRISKQEFDVLLGYLIEKELGDSIKYQLDQLMPRRATKPRGFSFLNYEWRRSYAR